MDVPLPLILTGGQTGIDLAATDAAIAVGLDWGGWVPEGRVNEDGPIPARYDRFVAADVADPAVRTRLNVKAADALLVLTGSGPSPGTELAVDLARTLGRPQCAVGLWEEDAELRAVTFLRSARPNVLNVAGPRRSELAGVGRDAGATVDRAAAVLVAVFSGLRSG